TNGANTESHGANTESHGATTTNGANTQSHDASPPAVTPTRVKVSNRDKVFWPDEGYTKGDLIEYYAALAPAMLPFLADRPVVMVRYPDGIRGKSFYQWNVPQGTPDWLRRTMLRDSSDPDKREKVVFLVDDVDALI